MTLSVVVETNPTIQSMGKKGAKVSTKGQEEATTESGE